MNDKTSVNVIKKKLRKRKNIQKTSEVLFYENELSNLLKSSQLISAAEKKPAESLPVSNVENESLELDLKSTNRQIAELEDTRQRLVIYKKLVIVRGQHSRQESNRQSIERLDGLLEQIDGRLIEYRAAKQRIFGIL